LQQIPIQIRMFIVVDSGSTKADWAIIGDDDKVNIVSTPGINPSTQDELLSMEEYPAIKTSLSKAKSIHFYGAGISVPANQQKIEQWLIIQAAKCYIETASDVLAGARACFGDKPGILAILGTGSNASYYDGEQLHESIPSLGYILSDEGGGVHIGKEILRGYIYGTMPIEIKEQFEHHFGVVTQAQLLQNLYKDAKGSAYIAQFSAMIATIDHPWKDQLLARCMGEFMDVRLAPLKKKYAVPIKIIGSIGYLHRDHVDMIAKSKGIAIDAFVQKPINDLIAYHKTQNKHE
jgi:N-acetylglucosamine kinase-like BadF-type ATPase